MSTYRIKFSIRKRRQALGIIKLSSDCSMMTTFAHMHTSTHTIGHIIMFLGQRVISRSADVFTTTAPSFLYTDRVALYAHKVTYTPL